MDEPARMTGRDNPPTDHEVREWIGSEAHEYWKQVTQLIDRTYPGVFTPEWLYGGTRHGWSLRYRKSRSFCTLIPGKDRFSLLIVFGGQERTRVEAAREGLSGRTLEKYDEATTYHDGKWLLLTIDSDRAVQDAMKLLAVKRRPRA